MYFLKGELLCGSKELDFIDTVWCVVLKKLEIVIFCLFVVSDCHKTISRHPEKKLDLKFSEEFSLVVGGSLIWV